MLKQRIITALILSAIIILGLLYLPSTGFAMLLMAVWAVAAWEWGDLSGLNPLGRVVYAAAVLAALLAQFHFAYLNLFYVLLAAVLFWLVAFLLVITYPKSVVCWGSKPMRALMGLFVLLPSALALLYGLQLANGKMLFVYLVLIVASADIGAYFTGRAWGKKKMIPQVSPGKSWAGLFGGMASCLLLALIATYVFGLLAPVSPMFIIATVCAGLVSVLGDLLESMIKRHRGIKDSSQLLPGHGGFMDRIDSVTAAAPVFVLFLLATSAV